VQAPAAAGAAANTLEAGSHIQTTEQHSSSAADVDSAQDTSMPQPSPAAVPAAGSGTAGECVAAPTPAAAAAAAASLCELVPVPSAQALAFPDSSFSLRDYQQEAIQEVVKQWKAGSSVQLVMLPTGTGKTVVFAALARYLSQHYVPNAFVSASEADQGTSEKGVTQAASAVAAVAAQEQARMLAPAAGPAGDAEQHVAADTGSQSAAETEAAAAALDAGISTDAEDDEDPFVSFRALRRRRGNREQQQPQQSPGAAAAAEGTDLQPDHSSSPSHTTASASSGSSSSSSISSLDAGSAGCSNEASLASSSIDDSSSSSKRGRAMRVPRTCAPALMRVLVLAHRFELLHQVCGR
jgi:hypothetical protein